MRNAAERVIKKCGGHQAVADLLGIGLPSVYKWTYPAERGGSNGAIPTNRQAELLRRAHDAGIDLLPSDFFDEVSAGASDHAEAQQ